MLILRPFNVGDFIQFGSISGTVKSLSLFGTELSTLENIYIYAPNSSIWNKEIYNFSRNKHRRQDIIVGISYNDDINKAFKTIQKVLDKEERLLNTEGKTPFIAVNTLGASSVDILVRFWTAADHLTVKVDLTKNLKEALDKDGITIPFPTQKVEMYEMKTTKPAAKKTTKKAA